jgi:hypothetical protein
VTGKCLAVSAGSAGILVMSLYVPVDIETAGTGGVPLPTLTHVSASSSPSTPAEVSGTQPIQDQLDTFRQEHGALPAALTRSCPPAAPVAEPPPLGVVAHGEGPFANPDSVHDHVPYEATRGDLVVSAQAPTCQPNADTAANDLGRPFSDPPQVRYSSLCAVRKGGHIGACFRDEQLRFLSGTSRFVMIMAPVCPVADFLDYLPVGPEPLQQSLSHRNLPPSLTFAPTAFTGAYGLTATYAARPA